jgi:hypothetical protein
MKESIKKLASFIIIIFFVTTVFAMVTYAQDIGSNSTINNCTVDNNSNCTVIDNNPCSEITINENNITPIIDYNTNVSDDIPVSNGAPDSLNETNNGLQITALHPWTKNSQEYFNITDFGGYPVDLNYWKLEESHCATNYTFPSVIIQPGATLQVFTRAGQDSVDVFHMDLEEHIFSEHDNAKLVYESDFTTAAVNDNITKEADDNNSAAIDNSSNSTSAENSRSNHTIATDDIILHRQMT